MNNYASTRCFGEDFCYHEFIYWTKLRTILVQTFDVKIPKVQLNKFNLNLVQFLYIKIPLGEHNYA